MLHECTCEHRRTRRGWEGVQGWGGCDPTFRARILYKLAQFAGFTRPAMTRIMHQNVPFSDTYFWEGSVPLSQIFFCVLDPVNLPKLENKPAQWVLLRGGNPGYAYACEFSCVAIPPFDIIIFGLNVGLIIKRSASSQHLSIQLSHNRGLSIQICLLQGRTQWI